MVTLTTVMSSTYIQSERMQTCQQVSFTINAIHSPNTRHFDYFGTVSIHQMKVVFCRKKRCEDFELIFLFQTNAANDIDLLMLLISNSEQLAAISSI